MAFDRNLKMCASILRMASSVLGRGGLLLGTLLMLWGTQASAQCGAAVTNRFGGETTAVEQVGTTALLVASGTNLELLSLANPNAPASFSPPRRIGLSHPARKISLSPDGQSACVLLEDGTVVRVTILYAPFIDISNPVTVFAYDVTDILADGPRLYISTFDEDLPHINSDILIYDFSANGLPVYVGAIEPFVTNYGFDRLAKVGSVLWAGIHEYDSSMLGVEAWNVSNPAAPVRITTSLNSAPLGSHTSISAMQLVGSKLLLSYDNQVPLITPSEDWMRAVDISTPASPIWHPPVDLNGRALCMAATGNLLRISIESAGVGTWNTANPAALSYLGGYFSSFPRVTQMVSGASSGFTDYWAGGRGGLMTMNTASPGVVSVRSNLTALPVGPSVVRQSGNITAVLDYTFNTLRLYDYTLPEAQQLRSSLVLPNYSEFMEPGFLAGGVNILAIATKVPGAGDAIRLVNITNPAAPVLLAPTLGGFEVHRMCVTNSRLYAITTNAEFVIVELSSLAPVLRSTTPFGGFASNYTAITSWEAPGAVNKVVALGTHSFGLWLIDVTSAVAPLVSGIYNPVPNYHVRSMAKGDHQLYVNATVGGPPELEFLTDIRLEAVTVTSITNPVRRGLSASGFGFGYPPPYDSLTYVSSPSGKFLVGTYDYGDGVNNFAAIHPLANFFFFENYFAPVAYPKMPHVLGRLAPSATGTHMIGAADAAGLYQVALPTSYAPGFAIQPVDQPGCYGGTVSFLAATLAVPTNVTSQWYRRGNGPETAITDGPTAWGSTITGATDTFLTISNLRPTDRMFYYVCKATNSCGTTTSDSAFVRFCPADFDCSGGAGGTGGITVQDIFAFLSAWFAQNPAADFDGNGSIAVPDIFAFLAAWFAGC